MYELTDIEIKDIEERFNIKIIDARKNPDIHKEVGMDLESFINKSYSSNENIWLGFYEDDELRVVSLFHELGHNLIRESMSKYEQEKNAWDIGLKLALEYGITFSLKTFEWVKKQLETYDKLEYK